MSTDKKNKLWYRQSAKEWIEALPIGNGRMGAMVYGGTVCEKIQIDESSFWSGAHSEENNVPGTKELLGRIRSALLEKDYEKADRIGHQFVGNKNQYGTNMPVGELYLELVTPEEKDLKRQEKGSMQVKRSLDLRKSIAITTFKLGSHNCKRECFVSNPAQVFCMKQESNQPFDMTIRYNGIDNNVKITGWDGQIGFIRGDARETLHSDGKHGVHLEGAFKVKTDGNVSYEENTVFVKGAASVVCFLDLETDMFEKNPRKTAVKRVEAAFEKGYENCKKEHIRDVKALFERVDISLGEEEKNEIPTDVRIKKAAKGEEDLGLYALMYQFGRYVLIASSRKDPPLPTHMGGIWNDNIYNNIDCTQDMHIDMNLQMQYWGSGQCNLKECYEPFFIIWKAC